MRVAIQRFQPATVEVDLPERCPACAADLTAEGAMRECGWMAVEQACRIDGDAIDHGDDYRDFAECQVVTGYKCACGEMLAGEEG